jgi:hypothetical protein
MEAVPSSETSEKPSTLPSAITLTKYTAQCYNPNHAHNLNNRHVNLKVCKPEYLFYFFQTAVGLNGGDGGQEASSSRPEHSLDLRFVWWLLR